MTGYPSIFSTFVPQGVVTYGDNCKGKILVKGWVGKTSPSIENVYLIEDLKHNLLSINQLCDGNKMEVFELSTCLIKMAALMKFCLWK